MNSVDSLNFEAIHFGFKEFFPLIEFGYAATWPRRSVLGILMHSRVHCGSCAPRDAGRRPLATRSGDFPHGLQLQGRYSIVIPWMARLPAPSQVPPFGNACT